MVFTTRRRTLSGCSNIHLSDRLHLFSPPFSLLQRGASFTCTTPTSLVLPANGRSSIFGGHSTVIARNHTRGHYETDSADARLFFNPRRNTSLRACLRFSWYLSTLSLDTRNRGMFSAAPGMGYAAFLFAVLMCSFRKIWNTIRILLFRLIRERENFGRNEFSDFWRFCFEEISDFLAVLWCMVKYVVVVFRICKSFY